MAKNNPAETKEIILPETKAFDIAKLELPAPEKAFASVEVGESFGGSFPRMELKEGEVSTYMQYVRESSMAFEDVVDGAIVRTTVKVHLSRLEDGSIVSPPIASNFDKNFTEAGIKLGDIYLVKRHSDVVKKKGRGAGQKMEMYEIKVVVRNKTAQA